MALANVVYFHLIVSEFELESGYYVHARINTLWNHMIPHVIPHVISYVVTLQFFNKDYFGI